MTPASDVIERLGGHQAVAELLGLSRNAVQRWRYPSPRGHNNRVPQKHWAVLAEKSGGKVTLEELMSEEVAQIVAAATARPKRKKAA